MWPATAMSHTEVDPKCGSKLLSSCRETNSAVFGGDHPGGFLWEFTCSLWAKRKSWARTVKRLCFQRMHVIKPCAHHTGDLARDGTPGELWKVDGAFFRKPRQWCSETAELNRNSSDCPPQNHSDQSRSNRPAPPSSSLVLILTPNAGLGRLGQSWTLMKALAFNKCLLWSLAQ